MHTEKINIHLKNLISSNLLIVLFLWSILIIASFFWNTNNLQQQIVFLATSEAKANWDKDNSFRGWATKHGGLYVVPDERTPPNPYLAHIKTRDITTTDGQKLTLMNPAYMMRQMTEEYEKEYGIKGSITGQILLNPINKADDWEMKALKSFDHGVTETIEMTTIDNQPYLRLMRPMKMESGCIKCHGHLGFKIGDIRGGVSVSIPMTSYYESIEGTTNGILVTHIAVWLLGFIGIVYSSYLKHRDEIKESKARYSLQRTQKMEAIGQLTGGIAHDFNNLLAIIMGNLEILEDLLKDQPKINERVKDANKAVTRGADMIRQLLAFSRNSNSQNSVVLLNDVINNMDRFITRSITPEIELEFKLANNLWYTELMSGEFEDALLNLVINARDSMPKGGKLIIETSNVTLGDDFVRVNPSIEPGEYVHLDITDTGHGMSKIVQNNVFNPFFTTKGIGQGTGLGLSMVYAFIQHLDGYIKITSEENTGTTMHLYFPRSQRRIETDIEPIQPKTVGIPQGGETILLVDDEDNILKLSETFLNAKGYRCYKASNAEEAIKLLKQHKEIKLMFSDVIMPGIMNGFKLAEHVEAHFPQVKVLLTSGYTQQALMDEGESPFESNMLIKPYTSAELLGRIRRTLDNKS